MSRVTPVLTLWSLVWITTLPLAAQPVGESPATAEPAEAQLVHLIIDFGDGFQKHYTQLEYHPEMTALDVLTAAGRHPRGIKFQYRGEGPTAFVTSLDSVDNQGTEGLNWVFSVNKKRARQSCGITQLQPGDVVLWQFVGFE